MAKALAPSFRLNRKLESGRFASLAELPEHERIDWSHLCRVLRLTLFAPEIVEAILDGQQAVELTLGTLMRPCSVLWEAQRRTPLDSRSASDEL